MKPDQLIIVKLVQNNRFSLLMEKPCPVIIKLGVTNFTVKNNTFVYYHYAVCLPH